MISAYLTGPHSRSQELISAVKHNGNAEEERYVQAAGLIALQSDNGLAHLIDGMLLWNSPIEPVASCLDGVEIPATNIRRWYNTNTFFHRPTVKSGITYKQGSIARHFAHNALPKGWKAVLPAPYTFASLVDNQHYKMFEDLMLDFACAESMMVSELASLGCAYVQLDDPSLVYHPLSDDIKDMYAIKEAVKLVTAKRLSPKFSLHTYFEDVSPVLQDLFGFPVQDIGIDFTETNPEDLREWDNSKGLAFGVVDARNSGMEAPEQLCKTISDLAARLGVREGYVCPTTSLKYLPAAHADKKISVLGTTARLLQESS